MSKQILVVDDSDSIREVLAYTLREAGYDVTTAVDGKDALAKAEKERFRMVLTDLYMPEMDGLELIKALRVLENYKGVPILFLTTESQIAKKQEAKDAGATGWIVKPFQAEKLLKTIKRVLR